MAKSDSDRGEKLTRADCIIKRVGDRKKIKGAEIGVYKGSLSRKLLHGMPQLYLYMVDRWSEYSDDERKANDNSAMSKKKRDAFQVAYEKSKAVHNKFKKRSRIIKNDSIRASKKFKDGFFDFVFIDADHSFDAVLDDIQAWRPKVKKGGWLCGHDYHRQTVRDAVNEVFTSVEEDDDNTWFVRL